MPCNPDIHGFLLVNKPEGITSFSIVKKIRSVTGIKKVGHSGTLDPFASGLMLLALGKAFTTQLRCFDGYQKAYKAQVICGLATDTLDSRGSVMTSKSVSHDLDSDQISKAADSFLGVYDQMPPAYSAKKVNGKRAYLLARRGETVALNSKKVHIHSIKTALIQNQPNFVFDVDVVCSTGTYVRTLVTDILTQCHTVGYTRSLVRTGIGSLSIKSALDYHALSLETIRTALVKAIH
jgi:tRNA pseudouridine55 synthase